MALRKHKMSEIIEKYNLVFTYLPEEQAAAGITSVSPLLSGYAGAHDTPNAVDFLQFIVDQIINQNNTAGLTPPEIKGIKAHITKLDATLFTATTEDIGTLPLAENFFTLPMADFLAVLESWKSFLAERRTRKVEVKNGQGIISIITDGFANALVIEKAVAVNWPDYAGSIGEYYSVSQQSYEKQKELTVGLNAAVTSGADSAVFEAIIPFLDLFTNGEYTVAIDSLNLEWTGIAHDKYVTYADGIEREDGFTYNYYPYAGDPYLFSRSYNTIDESRVAYYVDRIKEGSRPKAIIYGQYVIDGHHKLLAYQQLRMSAPAVLINKDEASGGLPQNIIPQIIHVLKKAELTHVLMWNGNIADIAIYMDEEITRHLDVIFREKRTIGIDLAQLLCNAYHSDDKRQHNWALKRLAVLSKNKNQGNRQYLPYNTQNKEIGYIEWRGLYIENNYDFDQWQKILLNNKKPSTAFLERQKEVSERYRVANLQRHNNLVTPGPGIRQTNTYPDRSGKDAYYYVRIIVLIILLIWVLVAILL